MCLCVCSYRMANALCSFSQTRGCLSPSPLQRSRLCLPPTNTSHRSSTPVFFSHSHRLFCFIGKILKNDKHKCHPLFYLLFFFLSISGTFHPLHTPRHENPRLLASHYYASGCIYFKARRQLHFYRRVYTGINTLMCCICVPDCTSR